MITPFIVYMATAISIIALVLSHKFRKFFAIVVLFAIVIYGLFAVRNAIAEPIVPEGVYTRVMWVVEMNEETGIITFTDGAGLEWEFEDLPFEDWDIEDVAAVLLWDNGTPDSIYDDIPLCDPIYGGLSPFRNID